MIDIHSPTAAETPIMRRLMKQYHDTPMDLADASLVVAAESLGVYRIFTLDSQFYLYRLAGGQRFDVVPAQVR